MPWNQMLRRRLYRTCRPVLERLETRLVPANVDVLSYHDDPLLTGQNLQEESLTPANVNVTNFGKLFSQAVDGPIYAQPLYKANLSIAGGTHNVVFVATENDSLYAFDADSPTAGPTANGLYWRDTFVDPAHGVTAVPPTDVGNPDIVPTIGITGTPVIDPAAGTIYFVVATKEMRSSVAHYDQYLYALNIADGRQRANSPYLIGDTIKGGPDGGFTNVTSVSVPGAGDGSSGGVVRFNAAYHLQRPGLQLVNGVVYVAFGSHSDFRPYHGWVLGFDKTSLQPVKVFNLTPNAGGSGIWQSGGAVSADPQGNLYIAVGNGFNGPNLAFDPSHNNYSEAVLKLSTTGQLSVVDYFVPFEWQTLDNQDADLGSGGVMLLPDYVGSTMHPHLMVETGKSGKIYLIDRDNLGQNVAPPGPDRVVQTIQNQPGVWGNPAFFRTGANSGIVYYHGSGADLRGYPISNGQFDTAHVLHSTIVSGFPGTQPAVSANGIANPTSPTNGIVWDLQVDNFGGGGIGLGGNPTTAAILRAWNATSFNSAADELYDTSQASPRDQLGTAAKFTTVSESNGHVFVPTQAELDVLGLFPASTAAPAARTNLQGMLSAGPHIDLSWTNPVPAMGAAPTGIRILRSTDGTTFTPLAVAGGTASTYRDNGPFVIGQTYYFRVVAVNQVGNSPDSNTVMVTIPIASAVLTLAGVGSSSIGLSWTAVANNHYAIERSTNGTTFVPVATVPAWQTSYTDTGLAAGIYAYRIHAFNSGPNAESLSNVNGATVGAVIDHNSGFANPTNLTANGSAAFPTDTTLRLTTADAQTGSAFSNTRMTVAKFTTTFQVRLHEGTQPNYADGLTFVIQANAPTALGQGGAGLGYQGIGRSVAIKFGTFQYAGDPSNSTTGLFLNGAAPRGGMDTSAQVLLNSQDQKDVTLTYDGTTLTEVIVDVSRSTTFTTSYMVNIPAVIGSDTAYVGFTASTGSPAPSYWELQDIVNWQFTSQAPLPGAPGNLRVALSTGSQLNLAWNANSYNETSFQVERSPDGSTWSQVGTSTATNFSELRLTPGTYYYRVRAANANGQSPYSNALKSGVPGPILVQDQDVGTPGDPAVAGSASFAGGGVHTNSGAGSDIWNQADGFHFIYKPLIGDGMITARVLSMSSIQDTTYWAKAGVMIRESLAGNARDAYVTMTPQGHNQVQFLDRVATGGNAADIGDATNIPFPIWVRVVRQGNTFTGFYSTNGTTFIQLGAAVTIPMSTTAYVGLVASSANNNGANPNAVSTSMFDSVSVVPAVLQTSHLDVSAASAAVNPGMPVNITVRALDPFNNPVPGYRGTVHFTASDTAATLPPDYTFTAADNGVHTFSVTLQTLGRQSVLATDTASNLITGGTAVLVTNQAVLGSLIVAGFPSPVAAGVQGSVTVTAKDSGGNVFTGYRGTVHFSSTDPRAQLPADYTFTAADNGVHTFTATLNTPGMQSLTVTDATAGISGTQSGIQVVAAPSITSVSRSAAVIFTGSALTVSGTFADPVTGQTHQVVIGWGDATANTTLNLAVGTTSFSASHTYTQAGNFGLRVALTAANGGSDTVILTATAAAAPPPSGLVGWWTGDGTNTTTAPDIAGANPGTLVNGATTAPGQVGNTFSFNGSQWVVIPTSTNIPVGNATYTLMAWIKPNTAGNEGIIGYGSYGVGNQTNAFRLLDDGTGHLNFRHYWWGNDLDAFTTLPAAGAWHLAVAEFDGTTRKVVLDGQVIAMDTPTGHNVPAANNFAIGVTDFNGSGGETFNGLIDEAQVYSRALTLAEIQAIYNAGTAGQIKGVRVQNTPPVSITTVSRSAVVINEGGTLTVSGSFSDAVAGQTHQAVLSWGDGTANTTLNLATGTATFSANHVYAEEGNWQIQVTVMSADGRSDMVTLPVTGASVAPPAGLVGWWTGDGTNAAVAPDLAGSNPGNLINGASHAAGQVGNAFSFNGMNQYVDLPTGASIPVGNATYTLMAWIKPNAAGNEGIIGYGNYGTHEQVNAFRLLDNGTGHLNLLNYWWDVDLEADTNLPATGAWHLAVAEFDGTTRKIVLDGQVIAMDTPTGHNVPNAANFRIGSTNNGEFFNGLIDEAQVYGRALTLADIQAIYNAGTAGQIKGVRAADVPVTATGGFTFNAVAGIASMTQTVATFTDPAGAEMVADYTATINWGDNSTSAGVISGPNAGGVFTVQGSHTYAQTGTYTITVTIHHDTAADATATSTAQVAAAVLHLAVNGFPSPVTAGTAGSVTVTALDQLGETAANYRGTVHFSSSDPLAMLPGDYTFSAADNGVHTFSATLKTAGSQSLTATDTADAGITGTQSGIIVTAATVNQLLVQGFPSPVTAGRLGGFFVTAADPYGNTVAGYRGTVSFTSSDGRAGLPPSYTFTAADNGRAHFDAALFQAGTQSLTATDGAGLTGTQSGIVVTAAAADHFMLTAPATATAGQPFPIALTALDPYGNIDTSFQGTVRFASSDPQALLPPDYTFMAADNGSHTFSVTLYTAGAQMIGSGGTAATVTVTPAAAVAFFIRPPVCDCAVAGQPFAVIVSARDPYGNVDVNYTGTVTFSSTDPLAGLPADYTFSAVDEGQAAFAVTLYTARNQDITATDTSDPTITGSTTVAVAAAAAKSFFIAVPDQVAAGSPFAITVSALDPYGNIAGGYLGTVHFDSSDPAADLPPDYTFQPGDGGVATFAITLNTPGDQTLTATDTGDPSVNGSATVNVAGPELRGKGPRSRANRFAAFGSVAIGTRVAPPQHPDSSTKVSPAASASARSGVPDRSGEDALAEKYSRHTGPRVLSAEALDLAFGELDGGLFDGISVGT
jgi:hypothetical protein